MSQSDALPAPSKPSGQLDKKKSIILGVIGVAALILIFVKVIPQIGSYSQALDSLKSMAVPAFIAVIVSVVVYLAVYGLPYMAAAPGLRFWRAQQVNQAAFTISNGLPAGGAVGLAVQYGMLTTFDVAPTAATAAITAVSIWSSFISLGFPILGVIALTAAGAKNSYTWLGLLGLGILIAVVVIFVLVMRSESLARGVARLGEAIVHPLGRVIKPLAKVELVGPLSRFRADMYALLKQRWGKLTMTQMLVSITQFLILYVALRGIQGWDKPGTSIIAAFAAFGISQIMLMVPITPGGLGTVDALMITILVSVGASKGDATAADLVWRACSYVPQIVIGVIALVTWSRKAGQKFAVAKG